MAYFSSWYYDFKPVYVDEKWIIATKVVLLYEEFKLRLTNTINSPEKDTQFLLRGKVFLWLLVKLVSFLKNLMITIFQLIPSPTLMFFFWFFELIYYKSCNSAIYRWQYVRVKKSQNFHFKSFQLKIFHCSYVLLPNHQEIMFFCRIFSYTFPYKWFN